MRSQEWMKGMVWLSVVGICSLPSCSSEVKKTDVPGVFDAIPAGSITLGEAAGFEGEMGSMFDAPEGYDYGIDFSFGLVMDQGGHLTIDDSHNYDCDIGTWLMGPSYYLVLEDGTELTYDYEDRSSFSNYPGSSDLQFPGFVPKGSHKLYVRYYANGVCNMNGDVTVSDHYDIDRHYAYISNVYASGTWQDENQKLLLSYGGTFSWQFGDATVAGKAMDFAQEIPAKLVLKVTSVDEGLAEAFQVDGRLYCIYETELVESSRQLRLQCSDANVTSFPEQFDEDALVLNR